MPNRHPASFNYKRDNASLTKNMTFNVQQRKTLKRYNLPGYAHELTFTC